MSSITGPGLYRGALAYEILANTSTLPFLFAFPDTALSYLVKGPVQITPATRTLAQWFGSIIVALTVPLVLSWKNPSPGPQGERQIGLRRATYITLGAGEVALIGLMAQQYFSGADSGMTDTALVAGVANLLPLLTLRYFFLVVKPKWVEGPERDGKAKAN